MSRGSESWARVLARSYDTWGVDAAFTLTSGTKLEFIVIDNTRGVEIGDGMQGTATVAPALRCQASNLSSLGVEAVDFVGASVNVNGETWKVNRTVPKPSPFGAASGEVYFILVEPDV